MVRTSLATLTNEACLGPVMRVSRLGSYSSIHLLVPRYGSEGTEKATNILRDFVVVLKVGVSPNL
jgi:hypothetical protein